MASASKARELQSTGETRMSPLVCCPTEPGAPSVVAEAVRTITQGGCVQEQGSLAALEPDSPLVLPA